VGDGGEYYQMFFAWKLGHPYSTPESRIGYDSWVATGAVIGGVPSSALYALKNGNDESDYLHFWAYSGAASTISFLGALAGLRIGPHLSFMILHGILLGLLLGVTWARKGWTWVVSILLVLATSPLLWYLNVVHTEFLTFVAVMLSVVYWTDRRFAPSALWLAVASLQNISFAGLAALVAAFALYDQSHSSRRISQLDVISLVLAAVVALLHPCYYFFRHGLLTPTQNTAMVPFVQLPYVAAWFIDPDIGLFPNYPWAVALLALGILGMRSKKFLRASSNFLFFAVPYVLLATASFVSTTNLNHGAAPGFSRYCIWYLPLFVPGQALLLQTVIRRGLWVRLSTGVAFVVASIGVVIACYPGARDTYVTMKPVSSWIQETVPWLYSPPEEVFLERSWTEAGSEGILGVFGPGNHRVLVFSGSERHRLVGHDLALIDLDKLEVLVRHLQDRIPRGRKSEYYLIEDKDLPKLVGEVDTWIPTNNSAPTTLLARGWSNPETWGTWSDGRSASILIPGFSVPPHSMGLAISTYVVDAGHPLEVRISSESGLTLWQGMVKEPILEFPIPLGGLKRLDLRIANPHSPSEQGSSDTRMLGLGLKGIYFSTGESVPDFTPALIAPRGWLSAGKGGLETSLLSSGWYQQEAWGVWASAKTSSIRFPKDWIRHAKSISFRLGTLPSPAKDLASAKLKIVIEGHPVWQGEIGGDRYVSGEGLSVPLPGFTNEKGDLMVILEFQTLYSPLELGINKDTRKIGIGFSGVRFRD
jgi:hypothetical protein